MTTLDEIRSAAMQLPFLDRAMLLDALLESVEGQAVASGADLEQVIANRIEAFDRGELETVSAEESVARLRQSLAEQRAES